MNRKTMIQALLAHREAVVALETALKADAREEYEGQGNRATWDFPGMAKVVTSVTHDRVEVTDREQWLKWVKERYPDEVVMVPAIRNPQWEKVVLERLAQAPEDASDEELALFVEAAQEGHVIDDEGTTIPGVVYAMGGQFKTVSVTPVPAARRYYAAQARLYAAGQQSVLFGTLGTLPQVDEKGGESDAEQPE